MKLGIANGLMVTDSDLEKTVDYRFSYTDILLVLQSGQCDELAQDWLDALDSAIEQVPSTVRCAA
jgi:hypothetical protein